MNTKEVYVWGIHAAAFSDLTLGDNGRSSSRSLILKDYIGSLYVIFLRKKESEGTQILPFSV